MIFRLRCLGPLVCGLVAAGSAHAQMVRGTVTERATSLPVPGVLMTLERESGDSMAVATSVLSSATGAYAIRATGPGRYRIVAKRIGVRRFSSETFDLLPVETRTLDVAVDGLSLVLPEVFVSGLCVNRRGELARVASLWDEIRTALLATQVALRDRLADHSVLQYYNIRNARDLAVLVEGRTTSSGLLAPSFGSVGADSLSKAGYWHRLPGDSAVYHGPDAEVLTSKTFLRDHCFTLVPERQGLIGLAFQPARNRRPADIRGTIWVGARDFRLRRVEFGYTRLPELRYVDQVRGEVHFAALPDGAWVVQRWFIRSPHRARWAPRFLGGDAIRQLREQGGFVHVPAPSDAPPATLTGVLLDSAGRPLPGATIRLAGTLYGARTDDSGRFRIDSMPAGREAVVAQVDDYDRYDLLAADAPVSLVNGETSRVTLRAHNAASIIERLCDGRPLRPDAAVLLVSLIDSATATPFQGIGIRATWSGPGAPVGVVQRTNALGSVTVCGLPARVLVELSLLVGDSASQFLGAVILKPGEVAAKLFTGKRARQATQKRTSAHSVRCGTACRRGGLQVDSDDRT